MKNYPKQLFKDFSVSHIKFSYHMLKLFFGFLSKHKKVLQVKKKGKFVFVCEKYPAPLKISRNPFLIQQNPPLIQNKNVIKFLTILVSKH